MNMFTQKSTDRLAANAGGVTTVIARGVKVEGEFVSQGDVVIDGLVSGTLTTSGTLTIGPEAKIKATVKAAEAFVAGLVEGNMTVDGRLDLKASAFVNGDVKAEALSMEFGARLQGQMRIGQAQEQPVVAKEKERSRLNGKAALIEGVP